MVLLAAAICTKDGKALVSRQFVEMSKSRIEGLIATFPKLADPGKQHTFVETDSVRYVYQPLERLYVLLITTKASNILEDLETLRLFARVIPEYARGTEASDIIENAFQIIFAFDEIVALGYRESVSLSQIRTFTEMDSHEEKMFNALRENQMHEAREFSKRKARELELARQTAAKQGLPPSSIYNSFSSVRNTTETFADSVEPSNEDYSTPLLSSRNMPSEAPTRRGMQLGGGRGQSKTEMDKLTDMLRHEVPAASTPDAALVDTSAVGSSVVAMKSLHLRVEEKITAQVHQDREECSVDVSGILFVRANEENATTARIRVSLANEEAESEVGKPVFQTHPNIDKATFRSSNWLAIKPGGKPFLVFKEVAVLKWRLQTDSEAALPVLITCWQSEIADGFEVNLQFDLQDKRLSLKNFCITVPLPPSKKPPVVGACDGDYEVDTRRNQIRWKRDIVDADNNTGSLDFVIRTERGTKSDQFFPINLDFTSNVCYCGVEIAEALDGEGAPLVFSTDVYFHPEQYEIF